MKIAVVTTFSRSGWEKYAHRMIASFNKNWPDTVDLFAYLDDDISIMGKHGGRAQPILHNNPYLMRFKKQHKKPIWHGITAPNGAYNYRFDAVKFSHKPFALWEFITDLNPKLYTPYDKVIWMDADTVTHTPVLVKDIETKICVPNSDFCYLGRDYKYSECGFMVFDAKSPGALKFIGDVATFYTKRTFTAQPEWHDSFLFDVARKRREATGELKCTNYTAHLTRKTGAGHPLVNSFLGQWFDHHKGEKRKITGRPRKDDMIVGHTNPYWKNGQ